MRNRVVSSLILTVVAAFTAGLCQTPSKADTIYEETHNSSQLVGPGVTEYGYTTTTTQVPDPTPVVIEKPVVIENTTRTVEKQIVNESVPYYVSRRPSHVRRHVAYIQHRPLHLARPMQNISSTTTIEKTIEKPIVVERPVIQQVDRVVEKPVMIDRVVEKPVYVDRLIDRPVFVDRQVTVEKPVVIEKRVVEPNTTIVIPRRHVVRVDEY